MSSPTFFLLVWSLLGLCCHFCHGCDECVLSAIFHLTTERSILRTSKGLFYFNRWRKHVRLFRLLPLSVLTCETRFWYTRPAKRLAKLGEAQLASRETKSPRLRSCDVVRDISSMSSRYLPVLVTRESQNLFARKLKQGELSREKMEIGTKYNKNNECCGELENSWVARYITGYMIQDSYKSNGRANTEQQRNREQTGGS